MLLLHGTVKDVMNSLGQSNTVILIHSKLKVLLGDTVLFVLRPWVLMFQHQFTEGCAKEMNKKVLYGPVPGQC